jgi:hypothetical protein
MVAVGIFPRQKPGVEPGNYWLVVRRSDHQATSLVSRYLQYKPKYVVFFSKTVIQKFRVRLVSDASWFFPAIRQRHVTSLFKRMYWFMFVRYMTSDMCSNSLSVNTPMAKIKSLYILAYTTFGSRLWCNIAEDLKQCCSLCPNPPQCEVFGTFIFIQLAKKTQCFYAQRSSSAVPTKANHCIWFWASSFKDPHHKKKKKKKKSSF